MKALNNKLKEFSNISYYEISNGFNGKECSYQNWPVPYKKKIGSINMTYNAKKDTTCIEDLKGFEELLGETFKECLEKPFKDEEEYLEMSPELYFIWKSEQYITGAHIDNNVSPHFVIYAQTCGISHFTFRLDHLSSNSSHPETALHQAKEILEYTKCQRQVTLHYRETMIILPSRTYEVRVPNGKRKYKFSAARAGEMLYTH